MTAPSIDRATEIERLAALDSINYEVVRRDEAKRLSMRPGVLDQEVAKARRALRLERNGENLGQGRAVEIPDILPWVDAIEGDRVATGLASALKRYVVLSDAAADAIALWIFHTWLVDKFTITPRLAITSPTKGCGKTTILRFLNQVVRRPKRAGSISLAALFRVIEQLHPTVILDETEKYIEHGSELHAILNEGHCRGGTVLRVLGDNQELREFSVFAAVAFAANGRLPDDLEQRAIVIEMQRRLADENVDELREDRAEQLRNLAKMCARWADDVADSVRDHDPDMAGLINRVADNWRPIFAIADIIGEDWPDRARDAAAALLPKDDNSIGPTLLENIRTAFDDKVADRLFSLDLCEVLNGMEGKPWGDWKGKNLTPNQLAKLLKPFKIVPDTIRVGGKTAKGYYRHQFEQAWSRYLCLPPESASETSQRNNADESRTSDLFSNVSPDSCYVSKGNTDSFATFQKCEKPASNGHCYGVTFQKRKNGGGGDGSVMCEHCGLPGADDFPFGYGEFTASLHPHCRNAWVATKDDLPLG
jgi:hypothetical protein